MKSRYFSIRAVALYSFSVAVFLLCGGCALMRRSALPAEDRKLPHDAVVSDIPLGGLTVAEARETLQKALPVPMLTLVLPEERVPLEASSMGIGYDLDAVLLAAINREAPDRLPLSVDRETLHASSLAFAQAKSIGARDASVSFARQSERPIRIEAEKNGVVIDADALYLAIADAVAEHRFTVEVPCTVLAPAIKTEQLEEKYQCLGTFTTTFQSTSQREENRVFNIEKAAKAIDGLVLKPKEAFDCNAALGDRTAENGWREAAGIRNGRYVEEYGGGVCQLSSTLFNAVLLADLTVTERHPHSWPMSYVPIGRDATISTGGKNFCFVNDTSAPLTISAYLDRENLSLTVSLYGVPKHDDGSRIEIVSEQTGTLPPLADEVLLDESLPYGTRTVARDARRGKTSKTYRERYAADGARIERTLLYEDTYRSIAARVYVSTDLYNAQPTAE